MVWPLSHFNKAGTISPKYRLGRLKPSVQTSESCGDCGLGSVVGNLQTTTEWAQKNLSRPGCWGYPDMLEVGVPGILAQIRNLPLAEMPWFLSVRVPKMAV